MNCQEARLLLHPAADGELDASRALEWERHAVACPDCSRSMANVQSLKKAARQDALYFTAPADLRRRLGTELGLDPKRQSEPRPPFWNWSWLPFGAGMAAATACLLLTFALARPGARQQMEQDIVSSHIRSLMASHSLDVVSTDQHTVKPWFDGKLDFAPPVENLAAQGFPLAGGRLDYIGGRNVAALVFQRHKHTINVFIWPDAQPDSNPRPSSPRQGYNLVHWSQAGMSLWAASDLNEAELLEFARDFAAGEHPPTEPRP